jgi:hypothetical protein
LEERNAIVLATTAGVRLTAIWKQKKDRWHIVDSENDRNLDKIVEILTPRQFQDAVENGRYFLK